MLIDVGTAVTSFARQTGDLAVLSQEDLRICALALTTQLQLDGYDHVRPALGRPSPAEARQKLRADQRRARRHAKKQASGPSQTQKAQAAQEDAPEKVHQEDDEGEWQQVGSSNKKDNTGDSDSDAGDWITPDNIKQHKAKALGLNPAEVASENGIQEKTDMSREGDAAAKGCACLTGDFAMQNVLMQMGLTALGPDGMQVKQVRTWVLRCHACFKCVHLSSLWGAIHLPTSARSDKDCVSCISRLCKNPSEKFCPSCGNATLMRTSITYLDAPTPEHPQGYVLHLKKNFQYHNRGTVYSIPTPKSTGGSSKGPKDQVLILRPDQKEYLRGKKAYDVTKRKEERKAQRELAADAADGGLGAGRRAEEWIPTLELSEAARKKSSSGHQSNSIRTDKAGMPLVGAKGNPNSSRRRPA